MCALPDRDYIDTDQDCARLERVSSIFVRSGEPGSSHLPSFEDLSVVFQPIVRLRDRCVFGQEALVRCAIPAYADPPTLFDDALACHNAGALGRMIRTIAVPLCAGQRLFVNVHPGELEEAWLTEPDEPIFSHDNDVCVELTEAMPIADIRRCASLLERLRQLGRVELAIDDFGSGYSNFGILAELEPRFVKLDRSIISGIAESRRRQIMVSRFVSLCCELEAEVVAEGVETEEDLAAVCDAGVSYAQGFLLGRPAAMQCKETVQSRMVDDAAEQVD